MIGRKEKTGLNSICNLFDTADLHHQTSHDRRGDEEAGDGET
jgi:hypothetical protein